MTNSKLGSAARPVAVAALVLLTTLLHTGAARAQWATSGNNINNTNTGNVGVGTTAPEQKLGVEGMFGLYPTTWSLPTRRGLFFFHGGTEGLIYAYNYPGGAGDPLGLRGSLLSFSTYVGGVSHERMTVAGGGNVGVGTTTPVSKLHLYQGAPNTRTGISIDTAGTQGGQQSELNLFTQGDGVKDVGVAGTRGWHFAARGNAYAGPAEQNDLQLYSWNGTSLTIRQYWDAAGNVGVGTTAPGYRFDVQGGQVNASGGLCISGDCKTSWSQVGASQWTTTDANIHYGAGNVGVGTSTPAAKVDVNGSFRSWTNGQGDVGISHAGLVSTLRAAGNIQLALGANGSEVIRINNAGQVGIGTPTPSAAYKLDVNGAIKASGNINATGNITATGSIEAKYQDLAEWVSSTQKLAAGTVVTLDPARSNQVLASGTAYDTAVAGVISERPGLLLGEGGEGKVMVATTGRVKVKVDASRGPIRIGDLLVTSDVAGVAMRSEAVSFGGVLIHRPGTIIGKALEPLEKGTGEILVLLSMQ